MKLAKLEGSAGIVGVDFRSEAPEGAAPKPKGELGTAGGVNADEGLGAPKAKGETMEGEVTVVGGLAFLILSS